MQLDRKRGRAKVLILLLSCGAVIHFSTVAKGAGSSVPPEIRDLQRKLNVSRPTNVSPTYWEFVKSHFDEEISCPGLADHTHFQGAHSRYTIRTRVVITASIRFTELYVALKSLGSYPFTTVISTSSDVPEYFKVCFPHVEFLKSPVESHLAAAWNFAIERHQGHTTHFLMCNDDVLFPKDWIEQLQRTLATRRRAVWYGVSQSIQFSAFILPTETWSDVGHFNEQYMAYYEDDDYWIRIDECYGERGLRQVNVPDLPPVVLHRRVGWRAVPGASNRMGTNMKESEKLFFSNWEKVDSEAPCSWESGQHKTRKGVCVRRSPSYPRDHVGKGCAS